MRSFPISGFNSIKKKNYNWFKENTKSQETEQWSLILELHWICTIVGKRSENAYVQTIFFSNGSVQMKETEIKQKTTERKVKKWVHKKWTTYYTKQWNCDVQVLWKCNKHQSETENWNICNLVKKTKRTKFSNNDNCLHQSNPNQ